MPSSGLFGHLHSHVCMHVSNIHTHTQRHIKNKIKSLKHTKTLVEAVGGTQTVFPPHILRNRKIRQWSSFRVCPKLHKSHARNMGIRYIDGDKEMSEPSPAQPGVLPGAGNEISTIPRASGLYVSHFCMQFELWYSYQCLPFRRLPTQAKVPWEQRSNLSRTKLVSLGGEEEVTRIHKITLKPYCFDFVLVSVSRRSCSHGIKVIEV